MRTSITASDEPADEYPNASSGALPACVLADKSERKRKVSSRPKSVEANAAGGDAAGDPSAESFVCVPGFCQQPLPKALDVGPCRRVLPEPRDEGMTGPDPRIDWIGQADVCSFDAIEDQGETAQREPRVRVDRVESVLDPLETHAALRRGAFDVGGRDPFGPGDPGGI